LRKRKGERRNMKSKLAALSITVMLLMGMLPLIMPSSAVLVPEIFVSPPKVKFQAPCKVSQTFEIAIKVFNEFEDTGIEIYALEFKLKWNTSLLDLVKIDIKPPFNDPTKWFIIRNETGKGMEYLYGTPNHPTDWGWYEWDYYWLAITALDTTPGIKDKVPIVNLTFHIKDEPCWPDRFMSPFYIAGAKMSDPCGTPVVPQVEHGDYIIYSSKPDMKILPTEIVEGRVCKTHTIEIWLSNMTKVYDFGFMITFNSSLLNASVQCVKILFPPPFSWTYVSVGDGYVIVEACRPCEKPGLSCADMAVVSICLHTIFKEMGTALPHKWDAKIEFAWAYVSSKCPNVRVYNFPPGMPDPVLPEELNVYNATYYWRPKKEDLNLDCHVDIIDLGAIAKKYGTSHVWSYLTVTTSEPIVDLYDVVAVAKQFCKTITPTK